MKLSVLIVAIWLLQAASCRRLSTRNHLGNDMNTNSNEINSRPSSWVKIGEAPEPEQQIRQGETLELSCEASGSPAPVIQWYKGMTPLTDNDVMSNEINEYPPQGLAKVKAKLRLTSVLKQHEGTYICEARSGNEVATAATTVYVLGSGSKNFSQFLLNEKLLTPAKITYYYSIYMDNIGTDIELPCKADGNPRATVMWLDPSEQVIENGNDPRITVLPYGKLRIRNLRWNDMGPYTCVVKNILSQDNISTFLYPMLADK